MTESRSAGGSVFLVEDEVMIRMMVAGMLEELGYRVAAEAGDIDEALRLARTAEFDLAILDVNVNGRVISRSSGTGKAVSTGNAGSDGRPGPS
jgi:CheY-like chemotaxis protein